MSIMDVSLVADSDKMLPEAGRKDTKGEICQHNPLKWCSAAQLHLFHDRLVPLGSPQLVAYSVP